MSEYLKDFGELQEQRDDLKSVLENSVGIFFEDGCFLELEPRVNDESIYSHKDEDYLNDRNYNSLGRCWSFLPPSFLVPLRTSSIGICAILILSYIEDCESGEMSSLAEYLLGRVDHLSSQF